MILRAIGRLIMVPLAFLLASGAALAVLFSLGLERLTRAASGRQLDAGSLDLVIDLVGGLLGLAGAATVLPALLVVVVGEVARIRSALYYVLGGGIALALLPALARSPVGPLAQAWPILATAGFAGGFVYWLLAGRNA